MSTPIDALIAQLQEAGLAAPEQLAEFTAAGATPPDVAALIARLVERGVLTPFQAAQVAAGKAKTLVIGAYVMLDRLNGGGGLLFKAQQRRMQRTVMIKPLPPSLMKSAAARVQRETALAGRTVHANLVAVQDLDEVGGASFLVTEFVDGPDLASLIKQQGRLAVDAACNYAAQAAAGLAAAHAQGLVHREVKAENLFVDRAGVVKVFGLGTAASEAGNAADDVAALGRTLQRLLTGNDVPVGAPLPALRTIRPDASPALEAYVARLTAAVAADRPTMAEAAAALASPTTLPAPPAPVEEASPFPELFADAEQESATVMESLTSLLPSAFTPAVLAPAALTPAASSPSPEPVAAAAAYAPDAPSLVVPPAPQFMSPSPAPAAEVAPAAVPEFAVNPSVAAPAFASAPAFAPSPVAPATSAPAAPAFAPSPPPSAAPVGEFPVSFAAAPPAAPTFGVADSGLAATATSYASSTAAPRKKSKSAKPIDLPFNLKLDPKYLEPKYLAGAGVGVVLLFTLLIYLVAGGDKGKVKPVPIAPAAVPRKATPAAAAAPPPGMFQLPDSNTLNTVSPAGTGPDNNFGLPTLPPPKPRR